jgi:putative tryptophan/tyrosine transport system substrate-binding protein
MRRRDFVTLFGGAAAWPIAAHAQQHEQMRRVGIIMPATADDAIWQDRVGAFLQAMGLLGWTIGRNVRIDTRWATTNAAEIRKHAAELAALAPDAILAGGTSSVAPMLQATRITPIVFTMTNDPVGAGFVDNLARPGGNATGFMNWEFSIGAKWLELLKEIAPGITRVALLRDASQAFTINAFATVQAVAPSLGVQVIPINMRRRRDRAVCREFRALSEWRLDPVTERCGGESSRSDRHASGPAQAAGNLLGTLLRRRRWLDVLWS